MSVGEGHALAIDSSGYVYSFGRNREGQLGHNDRIDLDEPKRIECLSSIRAVQVSCGTFDSCVLTSSGLLYEFGFLHLTRGASQASAENALHGLASVSHPVIPFHPANSSS